MIELIEKKKNGLELTYDELKFIVDGFINGDIPDYQMSSFLMAVVIKSMTDKETMNLTDIMLNSGDILDLSSIPGKKVDKHSTGGIGDKTTVIVAPIVASLGVNVAKMSGRGLGITGGTIDKLESIPGFKTSLSKEEFINEVKNIGVAIATSTGNFVPADKKIYALRDVSGTTQSIPLIASSIMSKKLASGADYIVIDLKVGKGALLKEYSDAVKLAKLMVKIGNNYNKKTICILTNMNEPLGTNVGNSLEIIEAIDSLKGKGSKDLNDVVIELSTYMVSLGKSISLEEARKQVIESINSGKAYNKFLELVKYQEGIVENIKLSPKVFSVKSSKTGYLNEIDALKIGQVVHKIGAGRNSLEDKIDFGVGISLSVKTGDYINSGEELVKVYLNEKDLSMREILDCFIIEENKKEKEPIIYEVIDK